MIYSVTFFSNELDILDLRLHELSSVVDKFILIESPFDYSRNPKRLVYHENKERFKEFHHKIIHIIDDLSYENRVGLNLLWDRVDSPLLYNALLEANDENLFVLFIDSDAILKKEIVSKVDITKPTRFFMDWYESYFNYRLTFTTFQWIIGIPFKLIKKYKVLQANRYTRGEEPQPEEFKNNIVIIENSGYHFSKCGKIEDLLEHIKGHPHVERAIDPKIANIEWLQNRRDTGKMWDDMTPDNESVDGGLMELLPYNPVNYPDYVNEHPEIFEIYFKNGMKI